MERPLFVKICGVKRVEDAVFSIKAGADAVGMVFYEHSPRCVDLEEAVEISRRVHMVRGMVVGVFVNENPVHINEIARRVSLDMVQLHGDESPEVAEEIEFPIIRAFRVKERLPLEEMHAWARHVRMFLLEGHSDRYGGAGAQLDPAVLRKMYFPYPFIRAGGLTPENVADRVRLLRPFGVDVSSGVESSPGVKDQEKIKRFIENARKALR